MIQVFESNNSWRKTLSICFPEVLTLCCFIFIKHVYQNAILECFSKFSLFLYKSLRLGFILVCLLFNKNIRITYIQFFTINTFLSRSKFFFPLFSKSINEMNSIQFIFILHYLYFQITGFLYMKSCTEFVECRILSTFQFVVLCTYRKRSGKVTLKFIELCINGLRYFIFYYLIYFFWKF